MDQRDRDVLSARRRGATETFSSTLRHFALALAAFLLALSVDPRRAAAESVRLVATGVEATPGRYAPAASSQDAEIVRRGAEIDRTVAEALEDMGLTVEAVSDHAAADGDLHAIAHGGWAVAPRFELRPGGALVRIVAVSPGSRVLLLREEDLDGSELGALSVRTVVMVRDIVESGRQKSAVPPPPTRPSRVHRTPPPPRSSGRAVLALNAAVYGGYLGFTLQRAGGEPDSRLVYPMVALGAGLGVGASLLVADEWDISHGDAWYLAAGAYWPGASGYLVAQSYTKPRSEQYLYGLVGATTGIGLGTVALATGDVGEGGAVLTHSGGAFGMLFGAMTEVAIEGSSKMTPTRGMGIGTGLGVVAAGATATQVDISSSRMLLLDLSVSLGGLSGAALASPLLFVEEPDETHTRVWLGAAFAGAVAGGVIGWYVSESWDTPRSEGLRIFPYAHHVPSPSGGSSEVGVMGTF